MDDLLTEAQQQHHRTINALVGTAWSTHGPHWERDGELPEEVIRWCAAQGLFGAMIPKEYGGLGWSAVELGLLYEALGHISASLASLVNVHGMVARTLVRWGSDTQRETLLPDLASGRRIAAVCMTERTSGSDLSGITTTLGERPDGHRLDGTKLYTTFGLRADLYLVLARGEGGQVCCLLERGNPGLEVTPMTGLLGLRAAALATEVMRDCRVERDAVIGRPGFASTVLVPHLLEHGRHAVAWMAAGMLRRAFSQCSAFVLDRAVFGRNAVDHGQIQSLITAMGVDAAAVRALCVTASRALDACDGAATRKVLMAKYLACQALERHSAQAVQAMGAQGCFEENGVAAVYRDAKVLSIIEGTPQLLERLLAVPLAREAAAGGRP
ncbi:acyl-CoA dehydrogenase family protein [Streptomyces sp. NPDC091377]|uniref:acyl-CoA dehydrogenase family protein n=1 Tax=Streptomyces sp. NPDC091377 TaxID=3365995 RepID=UPI003813647F